MKLAVSNIAWPAGADDRAVDVLRQHGVTGVELAPTKVWPNPTAATPAEIGRVRDWWESRGIRVVAFQALLFGKPDLVLFGSEAARDALAEHLDGIFRLAATVGAGPLVFGSPKNRLVGTMRVDEARRIAVDFFRRVGELAAKRGATLVLEANPPAYGCDFVTRFGEAADLVRAVDSPGFALHLDTGGMTLTGDTVADAGGLVPAHYHISEPNLAPVGSDASVPHATIVRDVRAIGYDGWFSIEMREPPQAWESVLSLGLAQVRKLYESGPLSP